jgi:ADP-ribosylglycohydrolase
MKKNKYKDFWSDGLSIDEARISAIIIAFMISFATLMYLCVISEDTDTVKSIVLGLITAITGINIAQAGLDSLTKKDSSKNIKDE